MRRLALATLIAAACGLSSACTPTYPKCDKDEHCKTDGHSEVCVNGMCQECGRDADCKAGFVCKESKCAPKPECAADGDCQAGFKCKTEKCVPECAADAECTKGFSCKAGRCTPAGECNSDADCAAGKRCDASQRCVEPVATATECVAQVVRFDFNEFALTADARRLLDKNAECLKTRKGTVVIAGHCDERGTEEYNLHLGERRANSVKKYLGALGIDPKNMKTVSYGKERPTNMGHDESAWSENRRVEFPDR
ncbi:MAG: OmpA family protein [Deltaproteobacteria bacterium]|nr:OmpA family protein [Deltaproteobacteria bacterium]